MATEVGLFEAMFSMRSMRRLKKDPIPDETLKKLIEAATQAPSGQNTQRWAFLVITDDETRRFFGENYKHWLMNRFKGQFPDKSDRSKPARQIHAATHLAEHMHEAPAIILCCGKRDWPFVVAQEDRVGLAPPSYGSIYPATQNLLLAARALGLGASLTTMHQMFEPELREKCGIPDDFGIVAAIPVGYPEGNFGAVTREPAAAKTHMNKWGQHPDW
ncbi:MAG: nitroreductase family protein [Pseudomonadota bacterium]